MSNIIFYFSGTGNSLKVAKTISSQLGESEIVSMAKHEKYIVSKEYDSIGFVFPVYFWGLPKIVIQFAENLDLSKSKNSYYYSIATCGGGEANSLHQLNELLQIHNGVKLNYGSKLIMFSNYVNYYEMKKNVDEITKRSDKNLITIITSIKNKQSNKIPKWTKIFGLMNKLFIKKVSKMDKNYSVNDNCTVCGICKTVCPVKNIELENNKPVFNNNCEQCVACIQYCPAKALNYKNSTQKRRRYTNPEIDYKELSNWNKK